MNDLIPSADLPAQLLELFEDTPVLVAAYDGEDRLRFANAAFRSAFCLEPGERPLWSDLMRRNYLAGRGTVIRNPDFDAWLTSTLSRRGKTGYRAYETDLVDGRWFWMAETVRQDGWMLCIASEITSLRADDRAVRQARDLAVRAAFTDELTGVANRRFVIRQIAEMIAGGPATGPVGCIGLIDLDHFKEVNDRFGHQVGDDLLRDFARRAQAQLRRSDCFGRIGGEEFMLVLPGARPADAERILQRMLEVTRAARPLPEVHCTFSAGIAEVLGSDHAEAVIGRADEALYAAKLAGRDRIQLYQSPPCSGTVG